MTDPAKEQSALLNAFRVLRLHGLGRQIPLLAGILLIGILDGIGIAALFPILSIVSESTGGESTQLQKAVLAVLDFLNLPPHLGLLCGLIMICLVAKTVFSLFVTRHVGQMSARIAQELRRRLLNALMDAKWSYFTVNSVGKFVAAATTEAYSASVTYRTSLQAVAQLIRTIVVCILALLLGWKMGTLAVAMGIVMGLSLTSLNRLARRAGAQRQRAMRGLVEELNDVLTGFKPLKAMNRHMSLIAELVKETKAIRRSISTMVVSEQLTHALPDLITTYLLAAGAYVAASFLGAPIDSLVIAGVVSFALMGNVAKVQRSLNQIAQSDTTYWSLQRIIAEATNATERFPGRAKPQLRNACKLTDVTFNYGRGAVLKNVDMEIPAGKITTVIGESGSGKTTIADLLLGLYAPAAGSVTVDGIDLKDIDVQDWRSHIGYVPQEIILFNDTIRANISLGEQHIDDAQIWEALRVADAADFVRSLPEGLNTSVGERGLKISGGQRQRIALARALAHRPKLLILDEATSALDPATEAAICSAIQARPEGLTVLAITHQPAWVDAADRIYRIEGGQSRLVDRSSAREIARLEA